MVSGDRYQSGTKALVWAWQYPHLHSKGGEWLISNAFETYVPEDSNEERQMVKERIAWFLNSEVYARNGPHRQDGAGSSCPPAMVKAGERGCWVLPFPKTQADWEELHHLTIVNEGLGGGYSFSVASRRIPVSAPLPILYFGTEEQRKIHSQTGNG